MVVSSREQATPEPVEIECKRSRWPTYLLLLISSRYGNPLTCEAWLGTWHNSTLTGVVGAWGAGGIFLLGGAICCPSDEAEHGVKPGSLVEEYCAEAVGFLDNGPVVGPRNRWQDGRIRKGPDPVSVGREPIPESPSQGGMEYWTVAIRNP